MPDVKSLAVFFFLLSISAIIFADFKEKTSQAPRHQCSFLKSLIDKQCREPDLQDGISVTVEKEQCKSKLRWLKIKIKGCKPMKVLSKECLGKCNSVWFPGPEKGELSCSGCFPAKYVQILVAFDCPKRKPRKLKQILPVVKSCKCQSFKCNARMHNSDK